MITASKLIEVLNKFTNTRIWVMFEDNSIKEVSEDDEPYTKVIKDYMAIVQNKDNTLAPRCSGKPEDKNILDMETVTFQSRSLCSEWHKLTYKNVMFNNHSYSNVIGDKMVSGYSQSLSGDNREYNNVRWYILELTPETTWEVNTVVELRRALTALNDLSKLIDTSGYMTQIIEYIRNQWPVIMTGSDIPHFIDKVRADEAWLNRWFLDNLDKLAFEESFKCIHILHNNQEDKISRSLFAAFRHLFTRSKSSAIRNLTSEVLVNVLSHSICYKNDIALMLYSTVTNKVEILKELHRIHGYPHVAYIHRINDVSLWESYKAKPLPSWLIDGCKAFTDLLSKEVKDIIRNSEPLIAQLGGIEL